MCSLFWFFFFKQKTAYEMRISDWSSDVCSSDLNHRNLPILQPELRFHRRGGEIVALAAELAGYGDCSIHRHGLDLLGREGGEDAAHLVGRAGDRKSVG